MLRNHSWAGFFRLHKSWIFIAKDVLWTYYKPLLVLFRNYVGLKVIISHLQLTMRGIEFFFVQINLVQNLEVGYIFPPISVKTGSWSFPPESTFVLEVQKVASFEEVKTISITDCFDPRGKVSVGVSSLSMFISWSFSALTSSFPIPLSWSHDVWWVL